MLQHLFSKVYDLLSKRNLDLTQQICARVGGRASLTVCAIDQGTYCPYAHGMPELRAGPTAPPGLSGPLAGGGPGSGGSGGGLSDLEAAAYFQQQQLQQQQMPMIQQQQQQPIMQQQMMHLMKQQAQQKAQQHMLLNLNQGPHQNSMQFRP